MKTIYLLLLALLVFGEASAQTVLSIDDTTGKKTKLVTRKLPSTPNLLFFPNGPNSDVCIFDPRAGDHAAFTGDMLFMSNGSTQDFWSRLAIGPNHYVLTSNGSVPTWADPSTTITGFVKTQPALSIDNLIKPTDDVVALRVQNFDSASSAFLQTWEYDDGSSVATVASIDNFGNLELASQLSQNNGGTGLRDADYLPWDMLTVNSFGHLVPFHIGSENQILSVIGGTPVWHDLDSVGNLHVSGDLLVDGTATYAGGIEYSGDLTVDGTTTTHGITNTGTLSTHGNIIQVTSGTATFLNTTVNTFHATQDATFDQSITLPVFITDTNYTMSGHEYLVSVDNSGGDITITLPDLATNVGKIFVITMNDANLVHVVRAGSDTYVTGATTRDVDSKVRPLQIWNNGVNWYYIEY